MNELFAGNWLPKLGAGLSAAGTALMAFEPVWGVALIGLGATLGNATSRQNNVSTEQVKARAEELKK